MVGSRYQLERIAYVMLLLWVMGIIHKDLPICDLFNDTAKGSDYLMSNMWLMSDELERVELLFLLATNQKDLGSIPDGVIGILMDINLPAGQWYLG